MSHHIITTFVVCLFVALLFLFTSCSEKVGSPDDAFLIEESTVSAPDLESEGLSVRAPIVHKNLAVYPVLDPTWEKIPGLITLAEAQEHKKLEVRESEGGSVPVLEVQNKSDKALFILAGEVVYGGKQDRIIQHDVIIKAGATARIDVRCVEAGRWRGKSVKFSYSSKVAYASVRNAGQKGSQGEVWREVRTKLNKLEAADKTDSSAYQAALSSKKVQASTKQYIEKIMSGLKDHKNVVGIVAAINGKIIFCDVFCHPGLFDRYSRQLVESAAIQALADETGEPTAPPSQDKALKFIKNALSGTVKTNQYKNGSALSRIANAEQLSFEMRLKIKVTGKDNRIHMNSFYNDEKEKEIPGQQDGQGQRNSGCEQQNLREEQAIEP